MEKLILVIGMHRSGTSATTGILNKMGLPLGDNLMPPTKDNPKGYYENMDFYRFNDRILRENKVVWHNTNGLDINEVKTQTNKDILKSIIKKYENYSVFGVKDPRLCILLPLYEVVCDELGIEIIYVRVNRKKDSIIRSIQKRDNFSVDYINNMIDAYLSNLPETVISVDFDDIIYDTGKIINFLKEKIPFLEKNNEVYDFIDKNLKRN